MDHKPEFYTVHFFLYDLGAPGEAVPLETIVFHTDNIHEGKVEARRQCRCRGFYPDYIAPFEEVSRGEIKVTGNQVHQEVVLRAFTTATPQPQPVKPSPRPSSGSTTAEPFTVIISEGPKEGTYTFSSRKQARKWLRERGFSIRNAQVQAHTARF